MSGYEWAERAGRRPGCDPQVFSFQSTRVQNWLLDTIGAQFYRADVADALDEAQKVLTHLPIKGRPREWQSGNSSFRATRRRPMHRSSESIVTIVGALAKAQAELTRRITHCNHPLSFPREGDRTFRYASLSGSTLSATEGFSHFVTSMTAPVACGWSGGRVRLAPTGKRRLYTAHARSGRMHCRKTASRRSL
jgi:hypothetical protein